MANNPFTLNITVPDGVEATARNGSIRLTGAVSYGSQRAAAEQAVAGLTGVRSIKDEIDVVWDADPVDVTRGVQDALDRYALIPDDSDVVVDTSANTVTLSGHVRTWASTTRRSVPPGWPTGSSKSTTTSTSPDCQRSILSRTRTAVYVGASRNGVLGHLGQVVARLQETVAGRADRVPPARIPSRPACP
jgi:BON domain